MTIFKKCHIKKNVYRGRDQGPRLNITGARWSTYMSDKVENNLDMGDSVTRISPHSRSRLSATLFSQSRLPSTATVVTASSSFVSNWPVFPEINPTYMYVRPYPPKEEFLGIAGVRCFTGQMPFLSLNQRQCQSSTFHLNPFLPTSFGVTMLTHIDMETNRQNGRKYCTSSFLVGSNKLCGKPRNIPRPCTPHTAAQLQPIHAQRAFHHEYS